MSESALSAGCREELLRGWLPWKIVKSAGKTSNVAMVAPSKPPITARPSGAVCAPPSPRPAAIGNMPATIAPPVMRIGRSRLVAPAITLDQLIERHGEPIFAKIDVEGFEAEALAGLSRPLEAFSFEFTTIMRQVAIDCVTRCRALGAYRYNAALGESQRLAFTQWVDAEVIERWLEALPDSANSGDIYARLSRHS